MSFLFPLFLAGGAAIGLPILLHLIRRSNRNRVTFSTLMFLAPTPPRFQRRSRLENLPLLLLRCLVVCLLAFAFARPFFPEPISQEHLRRGKQIALLIDGSASMRRGDLWTQMLSAVDAELETVTPEDRVCLIQFDQTARVLMDLEAWSQLESGRRPSALRRLLAEASPSWRRTDLGQALVTAAESLQDDDVDDASVPGRHEIILFSDLQEGSRLEALQAYEWPSDTQLTVRQLSPAGGLTNAALQLLGGEAQNAHEDAAAIRIRVTNSADASTDHFGLSWAKGDKNAEEAAHVTALPGQSSVIRVPLPQAPWPADTLVLTGDDQPFDNRLYVAPPLERSTDILFLGSDDPNDTKGMLYYLRRALEIDNGLNTRVLNRPGRSPLAASELDQAQVVVVTEPFLPETAAGLRHYLDSGRTLWLVLRSAQDIGMLAALTDHADLRAEEADGGRYSMLGRIDFSHPLLIPFAEPRFGDFTGLHFWRHRRLGLPEAMHPQILAAFDDGDPAWLELSVGGGKVLIWSAGWHPADSDLALSSKFVSLLYSVLEYSGVMAARESQYAVGDSVPLPVDLTSGTDMPVILRPDASRVTLDAQQRQFDETELPGLYRVDGPAGGTRVFAVNLPAEECRTAPLPLDDLEKLGVRLADGPSASPLETEQAQLLTGRTQIESQQQLWRRIVLCLLIALIIEIWLAGWLTRPAPLTTGDPT